MFFLFRSCIPTGDYSHQQSGRHHVHSSKAREDDKLLLDQRFCVMLRSLHRNSADHCEEKSENAKLLLASSQTESTRREPNGPLPSK